MDVICLFFWILNNKKRCIYNILQPRTIILIQDGLTIYPIGIRSVARRWIRRTGGTAKDAWFEVHGKGAEPALIGKPIHVPKAPVKRGPGRRIRGKR